MKALIKIKRAQKKVNPILGENSVIGNIFVLFTGMFDIATQKDINGGYRKI